MALPFQTALVTGANGFIGGALVLRLLAEGITVRAMCRNPINGQFLTGAEVVQGDVVDADQLVRLAHGCDVIFHLAAVGAGSAAIQNRVNIAGAENVARAAIAVGVGRLIHVSTVAVYGMHLRGSVTENTPFNPSPRDFYQQSKTTGERAVWQIAAQADLPLVVVRPALVYGRFCRKK